MKKNTLFLLNGLALAAVIASIYFIIQNYIQAFDTSLFSMQRFIVTQEILIQLLKRTIISTVLMVTGLACIGLFLMSYESERFLFYALLFFISAGFTITIWDLTIMFIRGGTVSLYWNRAGDLYLLMYMTLLFYLGTCRYKITKRISLYRLNSIVLTAAGTAILFLRPVATNQLTQIISMYYVALSLIFVILIWYRKIKMKYTDLLMTAANCLFGVTASFAKLKTLSAVHSFYKDMLPLLMMTVTIFFFLDFYQRHRTGILFGRETNRKLHELTRHKEKITQLIVAYFQRPVNLLKAMSVKLSNHYQNERQKDLLEQMQGYIDEINRYMKSIGEYSGIYSHSLEEYYVKINLFVLIKNALVNLESENIKWQYPPTIEADGFSENQIMGDPFKLIDANHKLLSFLYEFKMNEQLFIYTSFDGKASNVEFSAEYDAAKRRQIKRIVRQFSKKTFVSSIVEENLIPLSIAKQYIEKSKGNIRLLLEEGRLKICYSLPTVREQKETEQSLTETANNVNAAYHIVLVSTLPQQIELIEKYLYNENFFLKIFSSGDEALQYIENTKEINVIIVGDMFEKINAFQICAEIRKEYSLEQIPILMLSHEKTNPLKKDTFLYVNDIIYEPFEYVTLMQKLHSLIILQESVKESMLSRLEFLQAQMDPHFIFNTISTIMPLCIENPMEAYNLLGYFSEYLRGSLYHKGLNTTINLEQELELLNAYLKIQNVRFNNSIHYTQNIEVEDSVKILPLIIEPIVENSVKHGKTAGQDLFIRLDIKNTESGILFVIEDNGIGMSTQRISEILQESPEDTSRESHSIGIGNLKKRLQIYYQSCLNIESKEGQGTRISFMIPND